MSGAFLEWQPPMLKVDGKRQHDEVAPGPQLT